MKTAASFLKFFTLSNSLKMTKETENIIYIYNSIFSCLDKNQSLKDEKEGNPFFAKISQFFAKISRFFAKISRFFAKISRFFVKNSNFFAKNSQFFAKISKFFAKSGKLIVKQVIYGMESALSSPINE